MPTIKHTPQSIAELEREREQFKRERDELIEELFSNLLDDMNRGE